MIPKEGLDFQYFLAAFRRRLWYVVIPFFLVAMATVIYCIKAPRVYKSSSLILVQPQEVPRNYVEPTVTSDVQSRLRAITERILSRSSLEKVIIRHDLYPEIRRSANIQDAIEVMRKNIGIGFKGGRDKRTPLTGFEVSFEGKYPTQVREVASELAQLFIDYNFKMRAEQAAGTSQFLERELKRMREELRQKEHLVGDFRQKYRGVLPEQMENNYRILTQLQQQLDSLNTTLQKAKDRKVLLQAQLSKIDNIHTVSAVGDKDQEPRTLEGLRQQLLSLQLRYSDRHPDVLRLKALVASMEKQQQASSTSGDSEELELSSQSTEAETLMRIQKEDSLGEIGLIDKEIRLLQGEIKKTSGQIEDYQQRIELGPKIEQMFVDLKRDYDMATGNYQSLLHKKMQADLAENLESTQKGEQFRLQDPANFPRIPFKPDIQKLTLMGFMLALGLGFGLAFIREYLDPTFWSRKDLESVLQLRVIASIPVIQTKKEHRRSIFMRVVTVGVLLVMSSSLLYALFMLWEKSPYLIPL